MTSPMNKPGDVHSLSPIELEIVRLMKLGLTEARMASLLAISETAIYVHMRSIAVKLAASDRQATDEAVRNCDPI